MSANPSDLVALTELTEARQKAKTYREWLDEYAKHPQTTDVAHATYWEKELTYWTIKMQRLEVQLNSHRKA